MARGAELNHPARCQSRISPPSHVPPLAPFCSQTPSNASSRTDSAAFMNPEALLVLISAALGKPVMDRLEVPLLPRYSGKATGSPVRACASAWVHLHSTSPGPG
jgi:hypothetical protein